MDFEEENKILKAKLLAFEEECNLLRQENKNYNNYDILKLTHENKNELNRLKYLFTDAPAGICILEGKDHKFTFTNPIYDKLISNRDVIGKNIKEALPEVEGQGFFELLDNVYNTGVPFNGNEIPCYLKDENDELVLYHFNFIYQPVLNKENKVEGISVFCFDVTPQVKARQAVEELSKELERTNLILRSSEQDLEIRFNERTLELQKERKTLHDLFTKAPAIICLFEGPEHIFRFANPEYRKLYGYRDLVGKSVREALPELNGQVFFELLDNVYNTGVPFIGKEIVAKIDPYLDGNIQDTYFDFVYQPMYDLDNKVSGISVFAYDITEQVIARKRVEDLNKDLIQSESNYKYLVESLEEMVQKRTKELLEEQKALKESEDNYDIISENIPNLLWTSDADGNAKYFNKKFLDFVGLTFEEIKDWGWRVFIHPDDLDMTMKVWKNSLETGELYKIEYRLKKGSDSQYYWFIARALPLKNEKGDVIKWFGVCTDIHEQKMAEKNLENANKELERFNYIASHDLQSPIRTIVSFSNLLKKRYGKQLEHTETGNYLDTIIKASLTMKDLIDDLLSFSRVDKQDILYQDVDLNSVMKEVINVNESLIKETNTIIKYDNLPIIRASYKYIFKVFHNIISNGIKYQNRNSQPIINILVEQKDNNWLFKIQDNGIGIDKKYFEQIFEPFKRLHTKEEYSGSGIGLATVKKIIEIYHGNIWIESETDKGTTMTFTLPVV
ncbi:MAG: PAS domain-containing protein [Candidatus Sericytochromatia bacterium]